MPTKSQADNALAGLRSLVPFSTKRQSLRPQVALGQSALKRQLPSVSQLQQKQRRRAAEDEPLVLVCVVLVCSIIGALGEHPLLLDATIVVSDSYLGLCAPVGGLSRWLDDLFDVLRRLFPRRFLRLVILLPRKCQRK